MNTEARSGSTHATAAALGGFATLANDSTGIDTFERFLWQSKLAVLNWLSTLAPGGPIGIVAEMVEDLVIVEVGTFRFAQLKTRDKGSWSASKVCADGHAISSLVKSYRLAKNAGLAALSQFEVWLEGPPSEDQKTTVFFTNPAMAHKDIKTKIRGMGLHGAEVEDFLGRLRIHCHRPARPTIDAVVMTAIAAIWPQMQGHQVAYLYETLLNFATAAQSASQPPAAVRIAIAAGRLDPSDLSGWAPIQAQVMLRQHLIALCPPLSTATNEDLAERVAKGEATLLELKMARGGANPETVASAINARADADVRARLAVAGGQVNAADVEALDQRILSLASSVVALGRIEGSGTVAPAEHAFHTLMTRPADVTSADIARVFDGDFRLIVGHLCGLSDKCKFGWGQP